jgi:hypothetical protein
MTRTFETSPAVRQSVPAWFALFSASGAGKTFSLLRVATGMQSVVGGDIHMIDTEGGRGLHYAERFTYQYTPLAEPYGALDYLAAIEHVVSKGARIVIIDSLSHEHDGAGGLIDSHEAELSRMAGDDWRKREACKMLAWTKPKQNRKRLMQRMLSLRNVYFLLGFRADETAKPVKNKETGKNEVVAMGFMPVAGKNFVYEATVSALLLPGAKGVPTWSPENIGEKTMCKLPEQFRSMFKDGEQLSEKHGKALAEWARGGVNPSVTASKDLPSRLSAARAAIKGANTQAGLSKVWKQMEKLKVELDPESLDSLTLEYEGRDAELREGVSA